MPFNRDYKDLFRILNEYKVRYVVVGAYAVMYYTEPRYTKDVDIWVEPTPPNAKKVWQALAKFGAPLKGVTIDNFCNPHLVYQIGIEPNRIDIMMGVPGLEFQQAWKNRVRSRYGKENIYILNMKDLIIAKKTAKRSQDKIDLEKLQYKLYRL